MNSLLHSQVHKNSLLFFQTGLRYSKAYGTEKVRVLTLEKNRGKGGAIRLVSGYLFASYSDNFCKQIGTRSGPTEHRA